MAVTVILHAATRVIRRMTTDLTPSVAADELAVQLPAPIDIGSVDNGDGTRTFWKLDVSDQKVAATQLEAETAGVDPNAEILSRRVALQRLKDAADACALDGRLPATAREFFSAFIAHLTR